MKHQKKKTNEKLQDIFEDLMSRFIINVPENELRSTERICFQIEQAHWYYEDFIWEEDQTLPHFSLKKFAGEMFQRCPLLTDFIVEENVEEIYKRFVAYKMNVPVCGAIILNDQLDKVLLVRGWSQRASWTFPRGKINKDETEASCAIREVIEETGFDISALIDESAFIEVLLRGEQRNRFYIIKNVSEQTHFQAQTRKEIGDIQWHSLNELPGFKRRKSSFDSRFYMIHRVMPELQKWLSKYTKQFKKTPTKLSSSAPSSSASLETSSLELKAILGIAGTPTRTNSAPQRPAQLQRHPSQPMQQNLLHFATPPRPAKQILKPTISEDLVDIKPRTPVDSQGLLSILRREPEPQNQKIPTNKQELLRILRGMV